MAGLDARARRRRSSTSPRSVGSRPSRRSASTTAPRPRSCTSPARWPSSCRRACGCNGIAPGLVKTDMAKALWEPNEEAIARHTPVGRLGEPADIANVAVFLCSDAASWITGHHARRRRRCHAPGLISRGADWMELDAGDGRHQHRGGRGRRRRRSAGRARSRCWSSRPRRPTGSRCPRTAGSGRRPAA